MISNEFIEGVAWFTLFQRLTDRREKVTSFHVDFLTSAVSSPSFRVVQLSFVTVATYNSD